MREKNKYSKAEIQDLLNNLKEQFSSVKLRNEDEIKEKDTFLCLEEEISDHQLLLDVLNEKKPSSMLEFTKEKAYLISARYVEVDQEPMVLELVTALENQSVINQKHRFKEKDYYRDQSTGVYNQLYYEELERFNRRQAGIALVEISSINQKENVEIDEHSLQMIAKILLRNSRGNDRVIRYRKNQFLLVLEGINEGNLEDKLVRIREEIHLAILPKGGKDHVSVAMSALISNYRTRACCTEKLERFMAYAKDQMNRLYFEWYKEDRLPLFTTTYQEKPWILIVDDNEINGMILESFLEKEYRISQARNGKEALQIIEKNNKKLSLVLLDILMPELDGIEVLKIMARHSWLDDVPAIMISAQGNDQVIERCFDLGASDYIQKPFSNGIVLKRVRNILSLYQKQKNLQKEIRNKIEEKNRNSHILTNILSQVVECRNGESGPHVMHVEQITKLLLNRLYEISDAYPLSEEARNQISSASALHDIGKMGIDEAILNKPGKLSDREFEIMKTHTVIGANMVDNLDAFKDEPLAHYLHDICRWHHEKWDGRGYPDGLKGDEIPISAQVVSIADVYDALVSDRVYKKAYSHSKAMEMILNEECGVFNPILLTCLKDCHNSIIEVYSGGGEAIIDD